jgi:guanine deaminase
MSLTHSEAMREAIELSRSKMLTGAGGPFGAIVVLNGKVIGKGWNQVTSTNDPTAHAEVVAIRDACQNIGSFNLNGSVLYTSCEPCPMCLAATYWSRIDKIYYANTRQDAAAIGFDDEFFYQELNKSIADRTVPMEQIERDQAITVFKEWDKKADKIQY